MSKNLSKIAIATDYKCIDCKKNLQLYGGSENKTQLCDKMHLKKVIYKKTEL